jgi:hypothetical protein
MSLPEKLDEREQHFRIPGENGLTLFLRYLGPAGNSGGEKIVLYISRSNVPFRAVNRPSI